MDTATDITAAEPAARQKRGIIATPRGGRSRRRQLAMEAEAERRAIEAELLRDLNRPPTASDRIAIETISATTIRARRLRADGRSDAEERKLIAQLMRASGLKPQPITPPAPEDFAAEMLRLATPQPAAGIARGAGPTDGAAASDARMDGARCDAGEGAER
jgi:hypothetical protein